MTVIKSTLSKTVIHEETIAIFSSINCIFVNGYLYPLDHFPNIVEKIDNGSLSFDDVMNMRNHCIGYQYSEDVGLIKTDIYPNWVWSKHDLVANLDQLIEMEKSGMLDPNKIFGFDRNSYTFWTLNRTPISQLIQIICANNEYRINAIKKHLENNPLIKYCQIDDVPNYPGPYANKSVVEMHVLLSDEQFQEFAIASQNTEADYYKEYIAKGLYCWEDYAFNDKIKELLGLKQFIKTENDD